MPVVEICVDSVESAVAAEAGGAHRIELCSALDEGGLTPSLGLIRAVRRAVRFPVHVLVRPRPGDFVYSDSEMAILWEDATLAAEAGAQAIVFGILTSKGEVDERRTGALIEHVRPLSATFHRAFDLSRDLEEALEATVRVGVDCILTSGGEATALQGSGLLKRLVDRAGERVTIMAGGGVQPATAAELAVRSGVRAVHAALRHRVPSPSFAPARAVHLGDPLLKEKTRTIVRPDDVRRLRQALDSSVLAGAGAESGPPR